MFNLTVSEAHTYYVGQDGWLVHNANCGSTYDLMMHVIAPTVRPGSLSGAHTMDAIVSTGLPYRVLNTASNGVQTVEVTLANGSKAIKSLFPDGWYGDDIERAINYVVGANKNTPTNLLGGKLTADTYQLTYNGVRLEYKLTKATKTVESVYPASLQPR